MPVEHAFAHGARGGTSQCQRKLKRVHCCTSKTFMQVACFVRRLQICRRTLFCQGPFVYCILQFVLLLSAVILFAVDCPSLHAPGASRGKRKR